MYVLNTLPVAAVYALLPVAGLVMGLPLRVGIVASTLGIVVPVHFLIELRGGEYGFSALALMLLFLATLKLWRRGQLSLRDGILHGLAWGTAVLLSPTLLPVSLAWVGALVWRYGKAVVAFAITMLLSATCVLIPWAVRNALTMGQLMFLRSNFGLELQVSNNDFARATMADNLKAGAYPAYHPNISSAEALKVRALGEPVYNREKLHQAIHWMRANPLRFVQLTVARIAFFWLPKTTRWWQSAVLWVLTLLALAGCVTTIWPRRSEIVLMQLIWLAYPVVYYVMQTDSRYRYPIHWTLLLAAAALVDGPLCQAGIAFGGVARLHLLKVARRPRCSHPQADSESGIADRTMPTSSVIHHC